MYCKNCGKKILEDAFVCIHCGVKVGSAGDFCASCGEKCKPYTDFCMLCGERRNEQPPYKQIAEKLFHAKQKSILLTLVITILGGALGFHNFYLNYTFKGIVQILLFVIGLWPVSYVWALVELVLILTGKIKCDGNGEKLAE